MKRTISIFGALLAVLAVSAVAVSSASAMLPEFVAAKFPVTFTSESVLPLEPILHSSVLGEKNILCQMAKDVGEVADSLTFAKVLVDYTGCKEEGTTNTCTSAGAATGLIITKLLQGRINFISGKKAPVGAELEPSSGTIFAEFTCTGAASKVTVEGCTIGEAKPLDVKATSGELLFEENAEKNAQLYTSIEGGVHKPCEQTVTASVFKLKGKGWIMDRERETFSEAIEIKT